MWQCMLYSLSVLPDPYTMGDKEKGGQEPEDGDAASCVLGFFSVVSMSAFWIMDKFVWQIQNQTRKTI